MDMLAELLKPVPNSRYEQAANLFEPGSELKRLLRNIRMIVPISAPPTAASSIEQHITEKRIQVLRSYFGACIPSVKNYGKQSRSS